MFPVSDGHSDYLYGAVQSGYDMLQPKKEQTTRLEDMLRGGVALQFFACWIDTTLQSQPLHQCIAMIDAYNRMLERHPEFTPLTRDFTPESGKIATVLTVTVLMLWVRRRLGDATALLAGLVVSSIEGARP